MLQGPMLNRCEEMTRQDAQEDVCLCPVLQVMENRAFRQRALDVPEGVLGACQKNICSPDLVGSWTIKIVTRISRKAASTKNYGPKTVELGLIL